MSMFHQCFMEHRFLESTLELLQQFYIQVESIAHDYKVFPGDQWCGARLGGSKSNAINLILRLLLYHFLHTMSLWHHESIHNNTSNQQTPPPWWWSRSPLQRCGFDDTTPPEWRLALRIHFLRPLSKGLVKFNKLMQKSIYLYQPLCLIDVGSSAGNNGGQKRYPSLLADNQNIVID